MTPRPASIEPTSRAQYAASASRATPEPEFVRAGISAVALPVGEGNVPYTLCYLIEDSRGSLHVIDPGDGHQGGWESLLSGLRWIGKSVSDIAGITVTHFHPDHLGMAARLRAASGASIGMHPLDRDALRAMARGQSPGDRAARLRAWGVPREAQPAFLGFTGPPGFDGFEPDLLLEDGAAIDVPGRTVLVRHTPGHTAGHICLELDDEQLYLSGDHVIPTVVPGVGLDFAGDPGEAVGRYFDSLDSASALDQYEVLPGHGYRFRGLAARAQFIRARHLSRIRNVLAVLGRAPGASVWEVASQLTWSGGWAGLPAAFRLTALAQTEMYLQFARSGRAQGDSERPGS